MRKAGILLVFASILFSSCNKSRDITYDVVNKEINEISPVDHSEIYINLIYLNASKKINDASARAIIKGGYPPYLYKWSKQSVSESSNYAKNLTEGKNYYLTVSDRAGNFKKIKIKILPSSIDEKINAFFVFPVEVLEWVVMADIFASLGIYDPQVYDDDKMVQFHPNGDPLKISIPFVVFWLVLGATFFTIYTRFVNIRGFRHAIQLVGGKYDNPKDKGEVSHFQALTTALSATVGLGNISGVAVAITLGGPGATFWMIVAGFLGMSSKFVECTLGVKYREIDKKGHVSGGPMYYLSKGLAKRNMKGLGKVLAVLFSFLVIMGSLGGGNMFQANQVFEQFCTFNAQYIGFLRLNNFGAVFGVFMAVLVGLVIIGGIKSIAKVTSRIVPFMAGVYILTAIVIIFMNLGETGHAFQLIFEGAFNTPALKGGIIGVMIVGFQRAAFSNEAGVGSAPIAHSAVRTKEPVSEGLVSLLEPFIDTVVICTMTALVIIFTGFHEGVPGSNGVAITSDAFGSVFSWFPAVLFVAIFLFAFSTMISWSYYGLKGFNYLFAGFFKNKTIGQGMPVSSFIYFVIFLSFIVIGSASSLGAVLSFSDMMILSMAFPNILGLIIMAPEVKRDLKDYFARVRSGQIKKYK